MRYNHVTVALYYTVVEIRKNAWNTQTDREQRIQLQRPLLSPVDRRGKQANIPMTYQTFILH